MRNGSATLREEDFTKQTQVMLLRGWFAEDMTEFNFKIGVKLEAWLRRYSGKKNLKDASNLYTKFSILNLVHNLVLLNLVHMYVYILNLVAMSRNPAKSKP